MARWFFLPGWLLALGGCAQAPVFDPASPSFLGRPLTATCAETQAGPTPLAREPELEGSHPVDFYVQRALSRNPEILANERRVAAQAEVVPQVTSLPDPMLSNTVWPIAANSPQTASGRMPNSLMLSQQFPWFGKLRLRGEVANLETKIALTQLAESQLKVVEAVRLAYYDIQFNQRALDITTDSEKLLRLYIEFAEARYTVGQVSQQDVLRAQVELSKLQDTLIQLRQQLRTSQADLARLLATAPEADLRTAGTPELPPVPEQIDRLYQAAVASRPELQGRLQAILRDRQQVELARLQFFPDVTVGLAWNAITTDGALSKTANGNDNIGFGFAINLPIWRDKLQARVRETLDRTAESAQQYEAARNETFRLIRRLTVQAHALDQEIALYRKDIVPKADRTLRVSAEDYRVGKVVILQLIDNWTQLLRFQVQLARLENMLAQTLASLERVVGAELTALPGGPAGEGCPAREAPPAVQREEAPRPRPVAAPFRAVLLPPR